MARRAACTARSIALGRRRSAIRIAVGLAGACVAVFLFRIALHATSDRVRALALAIPALACSFTVCSERPLMFGLALLGVLVFTVEVPDSRSSAGIRASSSRVVMWLWVNVHGTFSLGFLYLVVYLVGRCARRRAAERRAESASSSIGTAIAAVLVFVNPYGPSLVLFPLALWAAARCLSNVGGVAVGRPAHARPASSTRSGSSSRWSRFARSKPRRGDLLMSVVFLLLGWWAVRNVAIAVAVTIPIVGRGVPAGRREPIARSSATATASPLLVVLVCLVGLLLVGRVASRSPTST